MWCGRGGVSHCTATPLSIHEHLPLAATFSGGSTFKSLDRASSPFGVVLAFFLLAEYDYVIVCQHITSVGLYLSWVAQPTWRARLDP